MSLAQQSILFRKKQKVDKDVCTKCNKKLPKINPNLLKDSLRMKSEIHNTAAIPQSHHISSSNGTDTEPGGQIGRDNRLVQLVPRNTNLHDCDRLHKHTRFTNYKRWDIPHDDLARKYLYYQQAMVQAWIEEEERMLEERRLVGLDGEDCSSSVHSKDDDVDLEVIKQESGVNIQDDEDYEEELNDEERVQNAVESIRKKKGGVLAEIQKIKTRHKQLEALTETKRRAVTVPSATRTAELAAAEHLKKDAMKKFLLTSVQLQRDLDFQTFKEKTTITLNRNFRDEVKSENPGLTWKPKWDPLSNLTNGKLSRSTHPMSDARKRNGVPSYRPVKPGDLPPCVYLPKHVEAKTAVESALLLDRFIKEAVYDQLKPAVLHS